MIQRGFALNVFPDANNPGIYKFDLFLETWVNGELCNIAMTDRIVVEFDPTWVDEMPDDQFNFTMMEVASQLFTKKHGPGDVKKYRESIAAAVQEIEVPLLDD